MEEIEKTPQEEVKHRRKIETAQDFHVVAAATLEYYLRQYLTPIQGSLRILETKGVEQSRIALLREQLERMDQTVKQFKDLFLSQLKVHPQFKLILLEGESGGTELSNPSLPQMVEMTGRTLGHYFNNRLTGIIGTAELMGEKDSSLESEAQSIKEAVESMTDLVEAFGKLDSGALYATSWASQTKQSVTTAEFELLELPLEHEAQTTA